MPDHPSPAQLLAAWRQAERAADAARQAAEMARSAANAAEVAAEAARLAAEQAGVPLDAADNVSDPPATRIATGKARCRRAP